MVVVYSEMLSVCKIHKFHRLRVNGELERIWKEVAYYRNYS